MAPMREMIGVAGIPPSEAATAVTDAILGDRFWIFTHDLTTTAAAGGSPTSRRGRDPTDPYDGADGRRVGLLVLAHVPVSPTDR